jgi:hypothetical protein
MYTLPFLIAKLVDIGLTTVYMLVAAIAISWVVEHWYGPFEPKEHESRSTLSLALEIVTHFFLLGVLAYLVRNVVERIPYPLEGVGGFQHHRLKEVEDAGVFIIVFLFYDEHLAQLLKYFATRIFPGHASGDHAGSGLGKFM